MSIPESITDHGTYKPASVKTEVRRICCLSVTLRRQRSGIGYLLSAQHILILHWCAAHQYENQNIEADVGNSFAHEERMKIDTWSSCSRIDEIPLVVEWTAKKVAFQSTPRKRISVTYHWNNIVTSMDTPYPNESAATTRRRFLNLCRGKIR